MQIPIPTDPSPEHDRTGETVEERFVALVEKFAPPTDVEEDEEATVRFGAYDAVPAGPLIFDTVEVYRTLFYSSRVEDPEDTFAAADHIRFRFGSSVVLSLSHDENHGFAIPQSGFGDLLELADETPERIGMLAQQMLDWLESPDTGLAPKDDQTLPADLQ